MDFEQLTFAKQELKLFFHEISIGISAWYNFGKKIHKIK